MKILLTGGCKNGKSSFAQKLSEFYSYGRQKFYLATMVAHDTEDIARIQKHIADRDGQNFKTVECGTSFISNISNIPYESFFLLDSITALLANEMFTSTGNIINNASSKVFCMLQELCKKVKSGIFVTDRIFCDSGMYTSSVELYRKGLSELEIKLSSLCDVVIEMNCGIPIILKGSIDTKILNANKAGNKKMQIIIGGAYQGKLMFAKNRFNIKDSDICFCSKSEKPDFKSKCLVNFENYIYYCVSKNKSIELDFCEDSIIICNDIFCGLVPLDKTERVWRERTGIILQQLAKSAHVSRVTCGFAEELS